MNTTDPDYYKWTQWIFLQMFKAGLAYKSEMNVNWCTGCKCVLANEEVVNGVCERCRLPRRHKEKSQWMLKITAYAQRLLDDLKDVNYLERIKSAQVNWIGRSTGAEVDFGTTAGDTLTVYTTRPTPSSARPIWSSRRNTPDDREMVLHHPEYGRGAGLPGGSGQKVRL